MTISEQITKEYFTFEKLLEAGFSVNTLLSGKDNPTLTISVNDMKIYLKSINDKIKELESDSK